MPYCYLTEKGLKKIENDLKKSPFNGFKKSKKVFPDNVKISQLESHLVFAIRRQTLTKVLTRKGAVNGQTIELLFRLLDIDLEDGDYMEKNQNSEETIASTTKEREAIATQD